MDHHFVITRKELAGMIQAPRILIPYLIRGVSMSRNEMIAVLVNDTVERMLDLRQVFWLHGILENGFTGFAKWSDDELRGELQGRGFDLGNPLDGADDFDSSGDCDDGHEFLRLAGHLGSNTQLHYLND
jgi:hypothetical protein